MFLLGHNYIGELGRSAPRANRTPRAARAEGQRRASSGGAANRQRQIDRALRRNPRAARKLNRNDEQQQRLAQNSEQQSNKIEQQANKRRERIAKKEQRQLSRAARQNARRVARMMKQRRRLFDRLFLGKGLRSLGNTPATSPTSSNEWSEFTQGQPNSAAAQAVVQFENYMLAQLSEQEIEAVGQYVSAVYAQNVTEANIESFTRAEMGKNPTLSTALMKLRSGWRRSSGRADTSAVMPNARAEEKATDFEDSGTSNNTNASRSANQPANNNRNLLIGSAIVAGVALFMLAKKDSKPQTRTRVIIRKK